MRDTLERDLGPAEPDRVLLRALTRLAQGLLERQARNRADAALISELEDLLGQVSEPPPPSGEPAWPVESLTETETRVLRYLPTHLSAREIAGELCLSTNTIKTHLHHLYRKLEAHSRHEAVQRARSIGVLAPPLRKL